MATYFASGSNRPGEIRGFADLGHPFGTVADQLLSSPESLAEVCATAGSIPVFVDSGAFSEVKFGAHGPKVVAPISDSEWRRRLAMYLRLAKLLGSSLSVVAPDKVGFPAATLHRLSKYREEIREIASHGARILVALQGSNKLDFWRKVRLLNLAPASQLIPSLPMRKNATPDDVAVEFVRRARPAGLHLLGLGISPRFDALLPRLEAASPSTELSLDACLIRRHVGRKSRLGKMTKALDLAQEELNESRWSEGAPEGAMGVVGDYTDMIASPSVWATMELRRKFARAMRLSAADERRWMRDPDAFLQEPVGAGKRYEQPDVAYQLDGIWARHHHLALTNERKRRGVVYAFARRKTVADKDYPSLRSRPSRPSRLGAIVSDINRLTRGR